MSVWAASVSRTVIGPVQAGADRLRRPGLSATRCRAPREVVEILEAVALRRLTAEPVEPVLDVGGVRRLRHLAVVDDRHAGRHLTLDDLVDGGLDACGEGVRIDGDAVADRPHHPNEVVGPGKASRVRAQDAIVVHPRFLVVGCLGRVGLMAFPGRTVLYAGRRHVRVPGTIIDCNDETGG